MVSTADYDEYCFYVAGLVGVGLSELFGELGLGVVVPSACRDAWVHDIARTEQGRQASNTLYMACRQAFSAKEG